MTARLCTLAAAAALAAAPAAAQEEQRLAPRESDLYAEMWALAGVCSQIAGFAVAHDDLADFLNDRLGEANPESAARVTAERNARVGAIAAEMERLEALPRGNRRVREVEENHAAMATRCVRLANNPVADAYFVRR